MRALALGLLLAGAASAQTAQLHNTTGLAFYYQGKYVEAFKEFVSALKKDPTFAAPHFNLGRVFEAQSRFEEAREQYRQTLQLDPGHTGAKTALRRLGAVARRPEPVDEPAPAPQTVDLDRQKQIVKGWIEGGELAAAEKRLYQLLRSVRGDPQLHDLLARVLERQGRFDAASEETRAAVVASPGSATYRYRHASNLFRLGRFDQAIEEGRKAAELAPNDYRVYYLLGLAYQRLDKLDEAFVNFEEAARINPEDAAVKEHLGKLGNHLGLQHYTQGLYHFAQKNWEEAKRHLQLALRKGNLNDEQRAIAQQYLIVADFSSQDVAAQIRQLQADRRNEQRGFVQKRLTFDEVERSPTIWRKGYHVRFEGRVAHISRDRRKILVRAERQRTEFFQSADDIRTDRDIRSDSDLRDWFTIEVPEPLPRDPRVRTALRSASRPDGRGGDFIIVEGQLQRPEYVTNPWNNVLGREPQPVVKATFVIFRAERNLSGDLRLDYLQMSKAQAAATGGPATPLLPVVGSPIPVPLLQGN